MTHNKKTYTPVILHFAPVLLGLHCLILSLSGHFVSTGFGEDTPNTWISLTQMFIVLLLVLPVLRQQEVSPGKRKVAFILTPVISLSILDEYYSWHESIGEYIFENNHTLPEKLVVYADDIIILISALVGGAILYYCIKLLKENKEYQIYFLPILFIAIAHGEFDIIAHKHYLWQLIWPDLTAEVAYPMTRVVGFYEETFKVWCEWFVILFLLRVYHEKKGYLLWSLLVFVATLIAPAGLWSVSDPGSGVPYIIMGSDLHFIRNYPLMIRLAPIWILWASVTWYYFKEDDRKRAISGLFLVSPFYLLLPQLSIGPIMNIENISVQYFVDHSILALQAGGLLIPLVLYLLIKEYAQKKIMPAITGTFVVLFLGLTANPLWLLILFGVVFLYWIRFSIKETMYLSWKPLIVLHISAVLLVCYLFLPTHFLPNVMFKPLEKIMFQTGSQKISKYRLGR